MRSRIRRILVGAIGLAVASVAQTAAPAQAHHPSANPNSAWGGSAGGWNNNVYSWGKGWLQNNPGWDIVSSEAQVWKGVDGDGSNRFECAETWVDMLVTIHRPPDLFVACQEVYVGWGTAPIHVYFQNGGVDLDTPLDESNSPGIQRIVSCRVDIRNFGRVLGSNCFQVYKSPGAQDWNPGAYNGASYSDIAAGPGGAPNKPERLLGLIENLPSGWSLTSSSNDPDILVTRNGTYKLVMQSDGNLVGYTASESTFKWYSGTNGYPGAQAVMQGDGNFVIYQGGVARWATSFCPGFSFVAGAYAQVSGAGQLRIVHPNGSTIWQSSSTGSGGCN